jgi:hypothetical protein
MSHQPNEQAVYSLRLYLQNYLSVFDTTGTSIAVPVHQISPPSHYSCRHIYIIFLTKHLSNFNISVITILSPIIFTLTTHNLTHYSLIASPSLFSNFSLFIPTHFTK